MNYTKKFQNTQNVTVSSFNPRAVGEREAISRYKEVKELPHSFARRCRVIDSLAASGFEVYFKTATLGGRARLFVVTEPGDHTATARAEFILAVTVK